MKVSKINSPLCSFTTQLAKINACENKLPPKIVKLNSGENYLPYYRVAVATYLTMPSALFGIISLIGIAIVL